jgi:CDP-diacylglycerol--serine O-phosphatidyltransferase
LIAFLFLACGALRLARFNVTTSSLPKGFFQGLPIPMAAGILATFRIFSVEANWPEDEALTSQLLLGLTLFCALLMVSTIPFPSFKEFNWRSKASFGILMAGVGSMILIAARPEYALFAVLSSFVLGGLAWNLWRVIRGVPLVSPSASGVHSKPSVVASGASHVGPAGRTGTES